jgi:K+/H+ antiporter YhaU regulatory subunit KhtT
LEGTQIEWLEVGSECALIGKSLKDAKIRQKTGVNVIAIIQAADQSQAAADPELLISAQDVFVALGNLSQLQALESLLYK